MLTRVTDNKLNCSEAMSRTYSIFCTGVTMVTRETFELLKRLTQQYL